MPAPIRTTATFTALVAAACVAGCGGGAQARGAQAPLPKPGPFFADQQTVRTYLTNYGVGIDRIAPAAAPDPVITRPARAYDLVTRGGSQAALLVYRSPNKALRARASAGPLTALGDNILAITAIGDCRIAKPCRPHH
jgi:hypothetical protein